MKVFTRELTDCRNCPNAVYDGSPWSGKGTDGAAAAKAAGVVVPAEWKLTSNTAFCKQLKRILGWEPIIVSGVRKTKATFRIPADCKLPSAGASPTPVGPALKEKVNQARALLDDVAAGWV